jgi:aromatic-L-amino-acid/L-tryptophan decarboxylase
VPSPLSTDREEMRRQAHAAVDFVLDVLDERRPMVRRATPAAMRERVPGALPDGPSEFEDLLAELRRDVLPYRAVYDVPGYLGFIPAATTWPGVLGDFLAVALGLESTWWMSSPGPSRLELVVLDWFREWIGYPAAAAGILVGGGSAANITALACARETLAGTETADAVVYASDQAHSSVVRAFRLLGFGPDQIRSLPAEADQRLDAGRLGAAMAADAAAGRRPLIVVANAGTTNTGAVDPMAAIAAVCREHGAWLHADAAYGGFAALVPRGAAALAGLEHADSVTLDPHKWLFQPIECGAVLVRDGRLLRRAFEIVPDYLAEVAADEEEVNFSDRGLQLTRACRALKVWLSLRAFGRGAFAAAIDTALDLAADAERRIAAAPELELLSPARLGIVAFRLHPSGVDDEAELHRLNAGLVASLEAGGEVFVSSTRLGGRYAVRICILHHETGPEQVEAVLAHFERAGGRLG